MRECYQSHLYPSLLNGCDGGLRSVMDPNWWAELSTVLLEDTGRLAQEVRALFQLPRHMHELDPKEAPFHTPLAPPCLHQQRFMPPSYLLLLAGTSEKFLGRRLLHMPKLCSASWNKITCQRGASHAFWQRACQTKKRGRILPFLHG